MRVFVLIACWMFSLPSLAQGDFFETHQLVFFFSSTCPHCHNASPHLKHWADEHRVVVQAFSFDNQSLPEFSNFMEASREIVEAAYEQRPIEYPALYVLNINTHQLYPVVVGEFTELQLEARMQALIQKIKYYEGA